MVRQVNKDAAVGVRVGSKEVLRHPSEVFSLSKHPVAPVHVLATIPGSEAFIDPAESGCALVAAN